MNIDLRNGDCLEVLKDLDDESIDAVISDPPYGLGEVKDLPALLQSWISGESGDAAVGANGFMGKEWDKCVPAPSVWKECLRVLKPGGHLLVFAGTRTQDLMGMSVRLAGFELRDEISYFGNMAWNYGSGFPKSLNISKAITATEVTGGSSPKNLRKTHQGEDYEPTGQVDYAKGRHFSSEIPNDDLQAPLTENGKKWEGYGTALKPAHEPILMFRKSLGESTVAKNVLKHGTGGLNIDACRIGEGNEVSGGGNNWDAFRDGENREDRPTGHGEVSEGHTKGRFPSNVILSHHPECNCVGVKKVASNARTNKQNGGAGGVTYGNGWKGESTNGHGVVGEKEVVEKWECHPECAVGLLDGQSYNDTGGASRFFYCAKTSSQERNQGLSQMEDRLFAYGGGANQAIKDGKDSYDKSQTLGLQKIHKVKNHHPTVKPIKLMEHLIKLVTPQGGTVLDPFMGSGSTGIACKLNDFNFIGIEREKEYIEIARNRIENFEAESPEVLKMKEEEPLETKEAW